MTRETDDVTLDDYEDLYGKPKNFWTTWKGILTILAIAAAATAIIIFGVVRTTNPPEGGVGVEAEYTDQQTDSVCGLGGVALEGSIGDTPEADWVINHLTYIPVSEQYGPGATTEDDLPYCWEHSPRGMMFAAVTFAAQFSNIDQYDTDRILELAFSEGDYREEHIAVATEEFESLYSGSSGAVGGFRLVSYDGDGALIEVVLTNFDGENTVLTSLLMSMVWQEGDWYLDSIREAFPVVIDQDLPDQVGFQQFRA